MTAPSARLGISPFIQPVEAVPHLSLGGQDEAILLPADPSKWNQPGQIPRSYWPPLPYVTFLSPVLRLELFWHT